MSATQSNPRDRTPVEALRGAVLAHAAASEWRLAVAEVPGHRRSGAVFCGQPDAQVRRDLRALDGRVILDSGRWRSAEASPADLFGFCQDEDLKNDGFLPVPVGNRTLKDVVASAPASVRVILTPTGFIPADRLDLFSAVIDETRRSADPRLIPLIPTDAQVLDPCLLDRTCRLLAEATSPVALILARETGQPFGRAGRMAGLRKLLDRVPDVLLLACEPAVALDAVLHGAIAASVGVSSALRLARPPHERKGGPATARMFLRELWEHRSPPTYAHWYGQEAAPLCTCGSSPRTLASFGPGDRRVIYRHTLRDWLAVVDEVSELDPAQARAFLAGERRRALDRHARLRPLARLREFDPVVRQLVMLDDGQLPLSLAQRRS